MKHYQPAVPHLRASVPVVGMLALLEERKATLEGMIRESFRVARETGKAANVSQLSATLRAVKRSLATAAGGQKAALSDE